MASLHTWVINLDRAPQRLARIGAQLDGLGLPWTRFPAVEGKLLPAAAQAELLDRAGFESRHGMTPSLGELGCYLSHVRLMQDFLASPHSFALVLEDDVKPTAALPEVLQHLMAAQGRWDMVKLSAIHSGTPLAVLPLGQNHRLGVMFSRCTGSSAYVVNRAAAQRYVEQLLPMQLPYDHAYDRGWVYGLKVRRVFPEVCVHDDQVESTIGNPGPSRKFAWYRRWPTYAHRLRTELRRVGYGLMQVLWHRGGVKDL
ncbi:MAG: glycosyltransferase family 25 protein [Betaproteobacteria bacterium]|nr:glycosyltransferase family 25 protein [Betaproteobacteria bacterium]